MAMTKVHRCPPKGSGVTPCCGRTPFELPWYERMTLDAKQVTCKPPTEGLERLTSEASEAPQRPNDIFRPRARPNRSNP